MVTGVVEDPPHVFCADPEINPHPALQILMQCRYKTKSKITFVQSLCNKNMAEKDKFNS